MGWLKLPGCSAVLHRKHFFLADQNSQQSFCRWATIHYQQLQIPPFPSYLLLTNNFISHCASKFPLCQTFPESKVTSNIWFSTLISVSISSPVSGTSNISKLLTVPI